MRRAPPPNKATGLTIKYPAAHERFAASVRLTVFIALLILAVVVTVGGDLLRFASAAPDAPPQTLLQGRPSPQLNSVAVKSSSPLRVALTPQMAVALADDAGASIADMTPYFPLLSRCSRTGADGNATPLLRWADVQATVQEDKEPFAAHEIRLHLDRIFMLLDDPKAVQCYQRLAMSLFQQAPEASTPVFLDLGSREIDSTSTFLKHYPSSASFSVHCFEANPKYNPLYPVFRKLHPNVNYYNYAVGVQNTTLSLSNRNVGSSVVDQGAGGKAAADSVQVPVIHFSEFLSKGLPPEVRPGASFVVMKMDIEKMEYAVLHQMLRTGTVFLLRELLLECHYTTNLPKEKRNPRIHIGKDDCYGLVRKLAALFPANAELPAAVKAAVPRGVKSLGESDASLETVLWNSVSTTRKSGKQYSERHGNFYPT